MQSVSFNSEVSNSDDSQDYEEEGKTNTIRFCQDCNNMLYPQLEENINIEDAKLVYKCETMNCNYQKIIDSRCRKQNLISKKEYSKAKHLIIDPEFSFDPTMPIDKIECSKCGHPEACYFLSTGSTETDDVMKKIYICASQKCSHIWHQKYEENE